MEGAELIWMDMVSTCAFLISMYFLQDRLEGEIYSVTEEENRQEQEVT